MKRTYETVTRPTMTITLSMDEILDIIKEHLKREDVEPKLEESGRLDYEILGGSHSELNEDYLQITYDLD